MLLLFRGSGGTAATLGISFGVTAVATATVTLGITLGLTPPSSAELNVSVTPDIRFGLTGNNIPYSTGSASVAYALGLTGRPGYAVATSVTTTVGLSGTVGSFFDGAASLTHTFALSGNAHALAVANVNLGLGLSGLPNITGGTISSAAAPGIVFDLSAATGLIDVFTADIRLELTATGLVARVINPDAVTLDKRPRTTLRSFLIG
jgi:hypothetical protein